MPDRTTTPALVDALLLLVAQHLPNLQVDQVVFKLPAGKLKVSLPAGPPPALGPGLPLPHGPGNGNGNGKLDPTRHSEDFRSIHWQGVPYSFNLKQAVVIQRLWEAWEDDIPELTGALLLAAAESNAERLRSLFYSGPDKHPAWGKLIVVGVQKGTYRLRDNLRDNPRDGTEPANGGAEAPA